MPSIKTLTPLLGGSYYHIFNRGINHQPIFYQERNYEYFLDLIKKYLLEYVDILAYSLLINHFHLVIKIKDVILLKDDILKEETRTGSFVSNQIRKMIIAYSMAINKQENRTGSLFDRSFKRLELIEQEYLLYVIFYVHYNREKHNYSSDFKKSLYSSYSKILSQQKTFISRGLVFEIFQGRDAFINYHQVMHEGREALNLE